MVFCVVVCKAECKELQKGQNKELSRYKCLMKFSVSQMENNPYCAFVLMGSKLMISMQEREYRFITDGSLKVFSSDIIKDRKIQIKKWTAI